jgi:Domain of unknown function DUF29
MSLYDQDFVCWTFETAKRLRTGGHITEADIARVAEEIEDMGKRDQRGALNRASVLLAHLLKWRHQPLLRSRSWEATVREQRIRLEEIFHDSPSLRPFVAVQWPEVYRRAVVRAERDTGMEFPEDCPISYDLALDSSFLPE